MKKLVYLSLLSLSFATFATSKMHPKVEQTEVSARVLRVDKIRAQVGRGIEEIVLATIQFSNRCEIAADGEIFKMESYTENFDNLVIAVGIEKKRACTREYNPISQVYEIGRYTNPRDGVFREIMVNGVVAK